MHAIKVKYQTVIKKIDNARPEKLFLIIASIFCGIFVFAIPPLQGWDESTHFLRAYQISEANLLPDRFNGDQAGGLLPINIINMNDEFLSDLIEYNTSEQKDTSDVDIVSKYVAQNDLSEQKALKQFEASAVYSPVAYAPAATGISVARLLNLPLVSYVYLARIFTLITFILLIYWAIKIIPVGKWVIFVVSLLPQSVTLAVSMGSDALIIGSSAILVALFVKFIYQDHTVTRRQLGIFLGVSVALGLMKPPYMLLSLLVLCIPIIKFGSKKRFLKWAAAIILATFLIGGVWSLSVSDIARNVHLYQRPGLSVNPDEQINFIQSEPVKFAAILLNQMLLNTNPIYDQVTQHVTWKGIHLPHWVVFLSYLTVILAFIAALGERQKIKRTYLLSRWGPILIGIGLITLIYITLYVSFTAVGNGVIEGVNGRYFTPLLFLILPAVILTKVQNPFISINLEKSKRFFVVSSVFMLVFTLCVIISVNYIPDF
jgi:uncharacterized membrane protein